MTWDAPRPRPGPSRPAPGQASMADEIKKLSSQLAQDPDSLVFLRLGELLRLKGQFDAAHRVRSEEHTSELQSRQYLVCRLLLEKKKTRRDGPQPAQPRSNHQRDAEQR